MSSSPSRLEIVAGLRAWLMSCPITRGIFLETAEIVFVWLLFGLFAYRMLVAFSETPNVAMLLVIVSEVLSIILVTVHSRLGKVSKRPLDWGLAFAGASAPLLVFPAVQGAIVPAQLCVALMIIGMYVQISAKVVLWRSFGVVAANRGVKVIGPYRFVRHPMYAGYTLTHIGFLLAMPSSQNATVYACALFFQIARLLQEERILKEDPVYRDYASRVRYRLLPGVF